MRFSYTDLFTSGNVNYSAEEEYAETVRRGEEQDRIAALPKSEKNEAMRKEKQRQAEWEKERSRRSKQGFDGSNQGEPVVPLRRSKFWWRLIHRQQGRV